MKTILITGANRGIGFETARQLAVRGFHVVIGARSEQQGGKAVRELAGLGQASLLVLDVSDSKSIASAASEFSAMGHLDVLINNAGIYPDEGMSVLTIKREQMVSTFQTNTFGALEMTQAFLPYMMKAPAARVINVSSGYGQLDGLSANVLRVRNSGMPVVGFTWYSLTDQVDWDTALRENSGRVNPPGLFDLSRRIRPVGKTYQQLIHDWGEVLPTQSVCLRVPLERRSLQQQLRSGKRAC
jgi:NAD(P)-dependent dehydrogenase (short-subunit alcohol dehydrogenase family)